MTLTRPRAILVTALAFLLLATGCSSGGSSDPATSGTTTAGPGGSAPVDLGRVVALGEEFLLADLLALGVKPVASTVTVLDAPFQGLDDFDTSGIEALDATDRNIERLASLRPNTIVASQFVASEVGTDTLEQLAERVVVAADGGGEDAVRQIGAGLGLEDEADALLAQLRAAEDAAAGTAPDGCEVALATIYVGPTPAVWIAGPNNVALATVDLGCELSPGEDDLDPDPTSRTAGRVFLSMENLSVIDAPKLILLQTDSVVGEAESLEELEADPLWKKLPAVQADDVHVIDRLGYPGVAGQIRLYADLQGLLDS